MTFKLGSSINLVRTDIQIIRIAAIPNLPGRKYFLSLKIWSLSSPPRVSSCCWPLAAVCDNSLAILMLFMLLEKSILKNCPARSFKKEAALYHFYLFSLMKQFQHSIVLYVKKGIKLFCLNNKTFMCHIFIHVVHQR